LVQFPVWCESARSYNVLASRDPSGDPAPMPELASVRK
jgi:hypothetical protein